MLKICLIMIFHTRKNMFWQISNIYNLTPIFFSSFSFRRKVKIDFYTFVMNFYNINKVINTRYEFTKKKKYQKTLKLYISWRFKLPFQISRLQIASYISHLIWTEHKKSIITDIKIQKGSIPWCCNDKHDLGWCLHIHIGISVHHLYTGSIQPSYVLYK